jgi:hypothetical protein
VGIVHDFLPATVSVLVMKQQQVPCTLPGAAASAVHTTCCKDWQRTKSHDSLCKQGQPHASGMKGMKVGCFVLQ